MIIPGLFYNPRIRDWKYSIPGDPGEILSLLVWYINNVTISTKYLNLENKKRGIFLWIIRYNFGLLNACR